MLHGNTEGLQSSISNVFWAHGEGSGYHANHFFVTSGLEAVTEYTVGLNVTFIIHELVLQSLFAAQVGLLSSLIFMYLEDICSLEMITNSLVK